MPRSIDSEFLDGLQEKYAPNAKIASKVEKALKPKERKQADILIELANEADLFHTPAGEAFADIRINGHRETRPIRSKTFKRWLAQRFYQTQKSAPNSEAFQSALNVTEAKAHFDGNEHPVHLRVAGLDDKLYIDLCDESWRAIEIDAIGWQVIDDPPVRFRRAAGMLPLPGPKWRINRNAARLLERFVR